MSCGAERTSEGMGGVERITRFSKTTVKLMYHLTSYTAYESLIPIMLKSKIKLEYHYMFLPCFIRCLSTAVEVMQSCHAQKSSVHTRIGSSSTKELKEVSKRDHLGNDFRVSGVSH